MSSLQKVLLQDATVSQDSGYDEYEGSLNDQIADVVANLRASGQWPMTDVLAVYPDFVLVHQYGKVSVDGKSERYDWRSDTYFRYDPCDLCWKLPYTYSAGDDVVTWGDQVGVEMKVVLNEIAAQDQLETGEPCDVESVDVVVVEYQSDATYKLPSSATTAARKGLFLAHKSGIKFKDRVVKIAEQIASGETLSQGQVYEVSRYFKINPRPIRDDTRIAQDASPSRSEIRRLMWGGDPGMIVSQSLISEIDALRQGASERAEDTSAEEAVTQDQVMSLVQNVMVKMQSKGTDSTTGIMHVSGIATVADTINVKNQAYPVNVWKGAMVGMLEKLSQSMFVGEADHPPDGYGSLKNTCMLFTQLEMQGTELYFEADILPTIPDGHNLQLLVASGIPVNMSSRGRGRSKRMTWMGQDNVDVIQPGFECDAFDAVLNGASPGSAIKAYTVTQSTAPDATPEGTEMTPEEIAALGTAIGNNVATAIAPLTDRIAALEQSGRLAAPAVQLDQSAAPVVNMKDVRKAKRDGDALVQSARPTLAKFAFSTVEKHIARLGEELEDGDITPEAYVKQVGEKIKDAEQFTQGATDSGMNVGMAHVHVKKPLDEIMPQTPEQMIEHLIRDLPDKDDRPSFFQAIHTEEGETIAPGDTLRTQKRQVRQVLTNMMNLKVPGMFNGRQQMNALCLFAQGYRDEAANLLQSIPDGATAVGAGGAPTTTAFVYPLYVYMFPRLFTNEISSVQPLSRPDGKIFFKRAYRETPGSNWTDEAGNVIVDRTPIDLAGGPIDPTYANDPGEFGQSNRIQMRFASKSVTATGKKLSAQVSIEELMDLNAYFGLDAMEELMADVSVEVAQELNAEVLGDLLAAASGTRAVTFNVTPPAGWAGTTIEWYQYIGRYIQSVSNEIFKVRNGEMTHMIAGPDAWQFLTNGYNISAIPGSGSQSLYAGLQAGFINNPVFTNVKMFKTNLWGQINRNQILVLRKGDVWSDTPHVFAPYADYVSPTLVLPDTMEQTQGYMHRAAHFVVAGSAIGSITIGSGTGALIAPPTAS